MGRQGPAGPADPRPRPRPADLADLAETARERKNRGRTLKDMSRQEPGFLRWILKGDFSKPVKEIARKFLPPES